MRRKWILALSVLAVAACNAEAPAIQPELNEPTGSVEILDESAYELLDHDWRPVIRARGYLWSEGPVWVEEGDFLIFSDVPGNTAYKYVPGEGTSVYLEPSGSTGYHEDGYSQGSNGLLLDSEGRLVLMQHGDRRVAVMDASLDAPAERYVTLADRYGADRLNSPNDAVLHSDGSLYFTDPPYGLDKIMDDELKELPFQGVYRLGADGELALVDDSLTFPNGIGLSPDEKTLYVAVSDPEHAAWYAWDVQDDGSLANKRLLFDATYLVGKKGEDGLPDGLAVHSSGAIFATGPGGVWMFSPDGEAVARILTGRATANCTLSNDEQTLYITANDTLMTLALAKE